MDLIEEVIDIRELKVGDKVRLLYIEEPCISRSNLLKIGDILTVVQVGDGSCKKQCRDRQKILCDKISKEHSILFCREDYFIGPIFNHNYINDNYTISSCYSKVERI